MPPAMPCPRRPRGLGLGRLGPSPFFNGLLLFPLLLLLLLLSTPRPSQGAKLQGGSALALAGKHCAVLAVDQRVGTRCVWFGGSGEIEGVCGGLFRVGSWSTEEADFSQSIPAAHVYVRALSTNQNAHSGQLLLGGDANEGGSQRVLKVRTPERGHRTHTRARLID